MNSRSNQSFFLAVLPILAIALFAAFPGTALASSYDIYTYGWYYQLTRGLTTLSIIMNDPTYIPAMGVVAVMGVTAAVAWDMTGGCQMRMIIRTVFGWVIAGALFYPCNSDTLTIYDTSMNKTSAAIPVSTGIAVIAVMTNTVDRGISDLIDLSGSPGGPITDPSGMSSAAMTNLLSGGITLPDQVLASNVNAFIDGCWFWAATAAGNPAGINLNNVFENNTDLSATLAQAALAGVSPDKWYSASDMSGGMSGIGMPSCAVAWAQISGPLAASPAWANSTADACAKSGFDKSNAVAVANCTGAVQNLLDSGVGVGTMDTNGLARQSYLSQKMVAALGGGNTSSLANLSYSASTQSEYEMAVQWTPANMGSMYTYLFAAMPLLVLFLPTALWIAVLPFVCGVFMYILSWHIIDMSLSLAVRDTMNLLLLQVQTHKLGLDDWTFLRDALSQTLATYEHARTEERVFAGIVAGLFGMGGGAMLEGTIRGIASSQARASVSAGTDSIGGAGSKAAEEFNTQGWRLEHRARYDAASDRQAMAREADVKTETGMQKAGAGLSVKSEAGAAAKQAVQSGAKGDATSLDVARGSGTAEGGTATGALAGTVSMGRALGYKGSAEQVANQMSSETAQTKALQAAGDGRAMRSLEDRVIGAGLAKDRAEAQMKISEVGKPILEGGAKALTGSQEQWLDQSKTKAAGDLAERKQLGIEADGRGITADELKSDMSSRKVAEDTARFGAIPTNADASALVAKKTQIDAGKTDEEAKILGPDLRTASAHSAGVDINRAKGTADEYDRIAASWGKPVNEVVQDVAAIKTAQAAGGAMGYQGIAQKYGVSNDQMAKMVETFGAEKAITGVMAEHETFKALKGSGILAKGATFGSYLEASQSTKTIAAKGGETHIAVAGGKPVLLDQTRGKADTTKDIETTTTTRGHDLKGSVFALLESKSKPAGARAMVHGVADTAKDSESRVAETKALADSWSADMGSVFQKKGLTFNEAQAKAYLGAEIHMNGSANVRAKGEVGTPGILKTVTGVGMETEAGVQGEIGGGIKAGADAFLSAGTKASTDYNVLNKMATDQINTFSDAADKLHLTGEQREQFMAQEMGHYTRAMYNEAEKPREYGASMPIATAGQALSKAADVGGDALKGAGGAVVKGLDKVNKNTGGSGNFFNQKGKPPEHDYDRFGRKVN